MKPRDGLYPFIEIFNSIFFIWGMKVIAIKPKPHKNNFDTKFFFKY